MNGLKDSWKPRRRVDTIVPLVTLVVALLVIAALVIGCGSAKKSGGFSGWLSGKPGVPATPAEQHAFQRANARVWAAFPRGTHIRRLIVERIDGVTFRLFGVRAGDEICLRLTTDGSDRGALMSCIPRLELVNAKAPAVVALLDTPAGRVRSVLTGKRRAGHIQRIRVLSSLVSFGVTADSVSGIEFQVGRRAERALVANNAFLFIRRNITFRSPKSGVDRISALDPEGHKVSVPFAHQVFRLPPATEKSRFGPTRIERKPLERSIAWIDNREPRGLSLQQAHLPRRRFHSSHPYFARVIQPDPENYVRVAIALVRHPNWICFAPITEIRGAGEACTDLRSLRKQPLSTLVAGGNQTALISGIASDAISRLDLFLNDGERWPVPLKDNAYVISVPRFRFPAKLVAYDEKNRVIGIQVMPGL